MLSAPQRIDRVEIPTWHGREADQMTQYVIEWDGTTLPSELRELPPGRYVMEPLTDDDELTPEEEEGLLEAIAEDDAGLGIPWEEAHRRLRAKRNW
jgi:hypothetical protein